MPGIGWLPWSLERIVTWYYWAVSCHSLHFQRLVQHFYVVYYIELGDALFCAMRTMVHVPI